MSVSVVIFDNVKEVRINSNEICAGTIRYVRGATFNPVSGTLHLYNSQKREIARVTVLYPENIRFVPSKKHNIDFDIQDGVKIGL